MHLGRLTRSIENAWHLDDAGGDGGLANAAANRLVKVCVGVVAAKAGREVGGISAAATRKVDIINISPRLRPADAP